MQRSAARHGNIENVDDSAMRGPTRSQPLGAATHVASRTSDPPEPLICYAGPNTTEQLRNSIKRYSSVPIRLSALTAGINCGGGQVRLPIAHGTYAHVGRSEVASRRAGVGETHLGTAPHSFRYSIGATLGEGLRLDVHICR